ncbi:hypothetical protein BGZ76_010950 [Entomortierella beljakovae]|nr:hypothetical protein BGZ76_010950 [Entomortierella beljakovae]
MKKYLERNDNSTKLEHWLDKAVPNTLTSFSITSSSSFVNTGSLFLGFQRLSSLTTLSMCTELLFTDDSFTITLQSLTHLRQFNYTYPCDAVQASWKDLFRYCPSCELYHRRMTTKTYNRLLPMPALPPHIQEFNFSMDEPKFQHQRIDSNVSDSRLDLKDKTVYSLGFMKSKSDDIKLGYNQRYSRPWWPDNLRKLDFSRCTVYNSYFDVPPNLEDLVIAYPLGPNEIKIPGSDPVLDEDKQWFPNSLKNLEIQGVPYHACCEIQESPNEKISSWMRYTNKLIKRVPKHLEHFTVNSFQVPANEALVTLQQQVGKSLKTWTVRLLSPQKPKESGYTGIELYASAYFPAIELGIYVDADILKSWVDTFNNNAIRETQSYETTPLMLRKATEGMVALEKLEVHINSQHYNICQAIWRGRFGLSEPKASAASSKDKDKSTLCINNNLNLKHELDDDDKVPTIGHEPKRQKYSYANGLDNASGLSATALMQPDSIGSRDKGKGVVRNFEYSNGTTTTSEPSSQSSLSQNIKDESLTSNSSMDKQGDEITMESNGRQRSDQSLGSNNITRHRIVESRKPTGHPKTEIVYWNNSCCGKRCLGWNRYQAD